MPDFSLNTAAYPTLTQFLVATSDGLYDHKAQQVAGKVTVPATQTRKITRITTQKPSAVGQPWVVSS